jgi:hypothetical protein
MSSRRFYRYEELKEAARTVRAELFAQGKLRTGPRVRKKPRDPDDLRMLYEKAMNTLKKYPARMEGNVLILPYFKIKVLPGPVEQENS